MNFKQRIQAFDILRDKLSEFTRLQHEDSCNFFLEHKLYQAIRQQAQQNKWFPISFIFNALDSIIAMLQTTELQSFEKYYEDQFEDIKREVQTILVISAGNIPLVSFHDFFAVLVSGNRFLGKLSSQDNLILPIFAEMLIEIEPEYNSFIVFTEHVKMSEKNDGIVFDKVISTGSNNSSRYFDYYFQNFPKILRRNRNSIAILTGKETEKEIMGLKNDIFFYFGLGCRSVSKIYIPKNYNFVPLIEIVSQNNEILNYHPQYLNNLDYQKTVHLMNRVPFFDGGPFILVENEPFYSPISVINYEYYETISDLGQKLKNQKEELQCISCNLTLTQDEIDAELKDLLVSMGETQTPKLLQYPDQIDVIKFCLS
jgi:hypothetical protein